MNLKSSLTIFFARCCALLSLLVGSLTSQSADVSSPTGSNRYADLSIEQLLNEPVTSVSKKETKLGDSPAAVTLITQEDIRRSGMTSLPELMRMVPGLDVARISANQWAISSRGFNGVYANKLLVLMDGRSVYDPIFAGVHWDVQDTLLEDIDRIEIIRGPGATLWGDNAVNGVINIITKNAKDTQGTLITGGASLEEQGFGGIRYGGKINDQTYYRAYVKYFNGDSFVDAAGRNSQDDRNMTRSGFRVDWTPQSQNIFTMQGDFYSGRVHDFIPTNSFDFSKMVLERQDLIGGNILGRWQHTFSDVSDLQVQLFYDHADRRSIEFTELIHTFDVDAQHRFELGDRNEIVWGLGYRLISESGLRGTVASFLPPDVERQIFSSFVQDEFKIVPDRLQLTFGTKFDHNDYSGFEFQPSGRLLFTPSEQHTFWASVSHAVRTPASFERDARLTFTSMPGPGGVPINVNLSGSRASTSEELNAYEIGYRTQPTPRFSTDFALFLHDYDHLSTAETQMGSLTLNPAPVFVVPLLFENQMHGESYGTEISANWKVTDAWKLGFGYSLLKMNLHLDPGSNSTTSELEEGDSPQQQFQIRSYLDLPWHLQLDTAAYYVDSLPHQGVAHYVRLDARIGWVPTKSFELSVGAQNLLDNQHPEFGRSFLVSPSEIERNFYAKLTWRF